MKNTGLRTWSLDAFPNGLSKITARCRFIEELICCFFSATKFKIPRKSVIFLLHFSPPDHLLLCSHENDRLVTWLSLVTFRQVTFITSLFITTCNNCLE